MPSITRRSFIGSTALTTAGATLAPAVCGAAPTAAAASRTAWYQDARFGLFMHWGPYSLAGVEASWPIMVPNLIPRAPITEADYRALPAKFNPVNYDPAAWVRLASQAGMRYMVFTTKHHDGFCMFDAPGTDYKITRTPYGKDIVAQLAAACKSQKMRLGFYYSPPDMNHPGYRDTSKLATINWMGEPSRPQWPGYLDYMESHVRTLLTKYGDVAILWFDGLFDQNKYQPERFHSLIHKLSPKTLINDRLGPELGDYTTPEQFFPGGIPIRRTAPLADFTPEMITRLADAMAAKKMPPMDVMAKLTEINKSRYPTAPNPPREQFQLWETCMTMNDTWGFCPTDHNFKSGEKLIRTLVEVASRGGNLLLNVGPRPDGTFPPEAVERLTLIGQWMERNGRAIHGTTYGPVQGVPAVRSTQNGKSVFLHVFDWPTGGKLELADFGRPVKSAALLAGAGALKFTQENRKIVIDVPAAAPDAIASVIELRV
jgi:alpha-L-fucosidase